MMKHRVRNSDDALLYLTDCQLATVSGMAMKKSRSKFEYERQIAIAQTSCDFIKDFNISPSSTRAEEIIGIQTVKQWAEQYDITLKGK